MNGAEVEHDKRDNRRRRRTGEEKRDQSKGTDEDYYR